MALRLVAAVGPAQLYSFAVKAKTLESQELAVLERIRGRPAAGTAAFAAAGATPCG